MDELEKVKIGILGCGKQAVKHIEGFRKIPGVEMVLADVQPNLAEKMAGEKGLQCLADPAAVFADPAIKAVDICTPTSSHLPLIRRAIASGKDFFCEKPLGATLEEVRRVKEESSTSGRVGMVGYVYRFAPAFELGINCSRTCPPRVSAPSWGGSSPLFSGSGAGDRTRRGNIAGRAEAGP